MAAMVGLLAMASAEMATGIGFFNRLRPRWWWLWVVIVAVIVGDVVVYSRLCHSSPCLLRHLSNYGIPLDYLGLILLFSWC